MWYVPGAHLIKSHASPLAHIGDGGMSTSETTQWAEKHLACCDTSRQWTAQWRAAVCTPNLCHDSQLMPQSQRTDRLPSLARQHHRKPQHHSPDTAAFVLAITAWRCGHQMQILNLAGLVISAATEARTHSVALVAKTVSQPIWRAPRSCEAMPVMGVEWKVDSTRRPRPCLVLRWYAWLASASAAARRRGGAAAAQREFSLLLATALLPTWRHERKRV